MSDVEKLKKQIEALDKKIDILTEIRDLLIKEIEQKKQHDNEVQRIINTYQYIK